MGYMPSVIGRVMRAATLRAIGTITHVRTQAPVAALTFDDSPALRSTPRLLDTLAAYGARATFFVVGREARRYPDLVRRIAAGGHAIGNHSWDHPSFPLIPGHERRRQIHACARAVAPYGCRLFRPPYGHQTPETRLDVLRTRHQAVTWSIVAQDWLDDAPAVIAERVTREIRPGSVVLFHDGLVDALDERYFDRGAMLDALRLVLQRLRGAFAFVTVPELLRLGHAIREPWVMESNVAFLSRLRRQAGEAGWHGDDGAWTRVPGPAR
jgi:peptidoglycan/xylan/chitin deacetylase (PgdA/CDA1 family)